jgi:predicted AAA+ superfamily ATPase
MTSKDIIEDVVEYWSEEIEHSNVIQRDLMGDLLRSSKMEEVTVLKGVRRSGKTFMLFGLMKKIGGTYINFEDERLTNFSVEDFEKLFDIAIKKDKKILYLDEVQEVKGWEKFAHRIHRKLKLFVTGSNSKLLSSDFSKSLVGRTKSMISKPLNYNEFLRFKKLPNKRESFLEYMDIGGFPRVVLTGDKDLAREYYDRIIYRDIIAKSNIRNPEALKNISNYLLSNIGKEFSYRSLKQISGLNHETTVREYVDLLQDGFLLKILKGYSPSLKKQEGYSKKIYSVDPAFIHLGKRPEKDSGRLFENIVYNNIQNRADIYFWKNTYEVDFILCSGLKPNSAINTTYEATEESTLSREIEGLKKISKKLEIPSFLVSVYPIKGLTESVEHRIAHRFLIEK